MLLHTSLLVLPELVGVAAAIIVVLTDFRSINIFFHLTIIVLGVGVVVVAAGAVAFMFRACNVT